MAELTEEEKIVIGVCSAVAALVILGILIFVCCVLYRRKRYGHRHRRSNHYHKERLDYDSRDRYYGNGDVREFKKVPMPLEPILIPANEPLPPPPMPLPPPPPPAPRTRWDLYGGGYRERSQPIMVKKEPIYISADQTYARDYRQVRSEAHPPVVIPLSEPEYIVSNEVAEPDTIYLKYRDDQALMYTQSYGRPEPHRVVRRARSMTEIDRPRNKFVGEWGHPIHQPFGMTYNERAARRGKDPFLWQD